MATTIEQAVHPLLLTCSVLGLGVYSRRKIYLSILYNLIVWSAYSWLYTFILNTLKVQEWFDYVPNTVHVRIGALATVTSVFMSIYHYKRFRMFMKRLGAVDDTLKELGTPKVYRKLHMYSRRILIGWIACTYIGNAMDMIWWFYLLENRWCMIIPYITNHHQHVNIFMDIVFMIFLWYIGTRFEKINEYIRCLIIKKEHGWTRIPRKYIMCANYYKQVFWTSMHLHLELCQIARELNTMFGPQVVVETIAYMVHLIRPCIFVFTYLRWPYLFKPKGNFYLFVLLMFLDIHFWLFVHMTRLFCINYFCENVSAKANETAKIIHQLTDHFRYSDARDEIYQFTLQIIHHPLKFTGLGLFDFGYSNLQKFFLTLATYLIIILQFTIKPKANKGGL